MALKKAAIERTSPPREAWDLAISCPKDHTKMHLFRTRGIALDICPKCFGVWLDGDEIGKILGPAFAEEKPKPAPPVNLAEVDETLFKMFLGGLEGALIGIILGI